MTFIFNEFTQQTIDFSDPKVVTSYNKKQHTDIQNELSLVNQLGISEEHTVIEFGPGTGALSIAMAQSCQHVFAVDTSQSMLDFIANSASEASLPNVSVHHAGFLSYTHNHSPVDVVVTKYALHHLPDFWKQVAIKKIFDLLNSGGRFYLEDVIYSFPIDEYQASFDSWISKMEAQGIWSADAFQTHINEEFSTFSWIIEKIITDTGFTILEKKIYSPTYASFLCQKP